MNTNGENRFSFVTTYSLRLFLLFFCLGISAAVVHAEECTVYKGSNTSAQNYANCSNPVRSALIPTKDGRFMRFQADVINRNHIVEYYDSSYNLEKTITVDAELPIYGGFYNDGKFNYILSGEGNPEEKDDVEVFKLTKYSSDWNKISEASLKGANTYIPFDAGSARMTHDGSLLFIRTCHEMYASGDGLHHQANVTIEVNTDTMEVVDSYYIVMNVDYGYVSHSFNQFIKLDGGHIIAVDHGDAYPRSIALIKYLDEYSAAGFSKRCSSTDLLKFGGRIGDNKTGASIGGFELSSKNYIVAGNTADPDKFGTASTRNIFLAIQNRNMTGAPIYKQLTNYPEGSKSASTPHLVKINDERFLVLWERDKKVNYTEVDADGNTVGSVHDMEGTLSDCQPIVANGSVIWYVWDNSKMSFYSIDTTDISKNKKTDASNNHQYEIKNADSNDNKASKVCTKCGHTELFTTIDSFDVKLQKKSDPKSSVDTDKTIKAFVGEEYDLVFDDILPSDAENKQIELSVSDGNIAESDGNSIKILKKGTVTVTCFAKFRPSVKKAVEITAKNVTCNVTLIYNNGTGTRCAKALVVSSPTSSAPKGTITVPKAPASGKASFVEWNTEASGTGKSYHPGDKIPADGEMTLYAIWK